MSQPSDKPKPWKRLTSRRLYHSNLLSLFEDEVTKPNGKHGKYVYTVSPPFVLVVAKDAGTLIFVKQYRYPIRRTTIEFPGGAVGESEEPIEAAKREFLEECGLTAESWTELGLLRNPNPGVVFLAEGIETASTRPEDDDGIIEVVRLSEQQIDEQIASFTLSDAKTLASLTLLSRYDPQK